MSKIFIWLYLSSLLLIACLSACVNSEPFADKGLLDNHMKRGYQWIRSRPFTLTSLVLKHETYDANVYSACNLNAALLWKPEIELFKETVRAGLPWHGHAKSRRFYGNEGADRFDEEMQSHMKQLVNDYPGCEAWLVWDEPEREEIKLAGQIAKWVRETWPNMLVYTDANPGGHEEFRGEEPENGYYYTQYLRDITGTIKPDVLMVDFYPFFKEPWGDRIPYFRFLCEQIRNAALEADVPYWMFIQAYSEDTVGNTNNRRYPSESDLRLQVFTTLAYGFTGLSYFIYSPAFERSILNEDGSPTRLYYDIARVNTEVLNIGQTLRFLRSTGVQIVAGHHTANGTMTNNKPGAHDILWEPGAGLDYGIQHIEVTEHGPGRDALIGFFEDDDNQNYFMLVNLWHGPGAPASDKTTTFKIHLAPGINQIKRLSRETGQVDILNATDGVIFVTLPGGTGDLFKCNAGAFAGLSQ